MHIRRFLKGAHEHAGTTDGTGQWTPKSEFIVSGTFHGPCKNYLKHFYTVRYARLLHKHKPKLYQWLHMITKPQIYMGMLGVDPKSDDGRKILAENVAFRMTKKVGG